MEFLRDVFSPVIKSPFRITRLGDSWSRMEFMAAMDLMSCSMPKLSSFSPKCRSEKIVNWSSFFVLRRRGFELECGGRGMRGRNQ